MGSRGSLILPVGRATTCTPKRSRPSILNTLSVDFVASCARDVFKAVFRACATATPPECKWLVMRLGTDDLPDAYRGYPVDDQLRCSVVAVWVPGDGWIFTVLLGLAYGLDLEAAVILQDAY